MNTPDKKIEILSQFLDDDVTLIETGTHLGYTSSACSKLCKHVFTAEINEGHARIAQSIFGNNPKISSYIESCLDMLKKISTGKYESSGPYVFWLDAHATTIETEMVQKTLQKELALIRDNFKKEDIRALLIDDSSGLKLASELLTVQECYDLLIEINPNFRVSSILRGGVYEGPTIYDADVLMAYDADLFDMTIKLRK
tara:strand:+ start:4240 stop:4836 length:597 start_codon:yes stop_codon:yes gene_type:complete